jgi:hypothetical protein
MPGPRLRDPGHRELALEPLGERGDRTQRSGR